METNPEVGSTYFDRISQLNFMCLAILKRPKEDIFLMECLDNGLCWREGETGWCLGNYWEKKEN